VSIGAVIFPTGTYDVTRTTAGGYVKGRYTAGATQVIPVVADVQDVTGQLLRDLPDGMRSENTKVVYTTTELRSLEVTTDPDVIDIEGKRYRVVKVQAFRVLARRYRAWVELLRA
jgi:hypothetical protein